MTDINLTGTISAASLEGKLSALYIPKDVTEYDGPTSITPSAMQQQFKTARKLVNENLVVEGAKLDVLEATENGTYRPDGDTVGFSEVNVDIQPDLRPLTVDTLAQPNATFIPDGFDGYSSVTVEEGWDGVLLPPDDGLNFYNKWVELNPGETLVIEGVGTGSRWFAVYSREPEVKAYGRNAGLGKNTDPSTSWRHLRFYVETEATTHVILAGYEWQTQEGIRRDDSYGFRGEYMRWKVIHAT